MKKSKLPEAASSATRPPASGKSVAATTSPARPDRISARERRSLILEAATARFARLGFESTTVRQIAEDVNIMSGSLYYHFPTKEDILNEIVSPVVTRTLGNTKRIYNSQTNSEIRLLALMLFSIGDLTREQGAHAILYNERRFFRANASFAHIASTRQEIYFYWRNILEEGMLKGQFRSDLDHFLTISTIMRMLNATADWFSSDDNYTLEQVSRFQLKFVLCAIRAHDRVEEELPFEQSAGLAAGRF